MQNIVNIFQIYEFFIIFLYFSFGHKLSSSQNKLLYFMSVSLHIFYIMLFKGLQQFNIIIICCAVVSEKSVLFISILYVTIRIYFWIILEKKNYKTVLPCGKLKCTEIILKYWNITANKTTLVLHKIMYLNYCIPSTFVNKYTSILVLLINNSYNYILSCLFVHVFIYFIEYFIIVFFLFIGLC